MPRGIYRLIKRARKKVEAEMAAYSSRGGITGAFASEGYLGGYRDALDDVVLALDGSRPQRDYWWKLSPTHPNEGARDE